MVSTVVENHPTIDQTTSQGESISVTKADASSEYLSLLGHTYLCQNGVQISTSTKATAMLTYLALEGVPHHREKIANLLWESNNASLNLRVELTNLRRHKLQFFAPRQSMLSIQLPLDIDWWLAQTQHVTSGNLSNWLAVLRGLPLTGLEDVGSLEFRSWIERQRMCFIEQIEEQLTIVHKRFSEEGDQRSASHVIEHAKSIGLELDIQSEPSKTSRTQSSFSGYLDQERAKLLHLMELGHNAPQLVVLTGARGISRMMVDDVQIPDGWQTIQLQYAPDRHQMHRALLLQVINLLPPEQQQQFRPMLFQDNTQQNDILHFGNLLSILKTPVLLAIHDMYEAPDWLRKDAQFLMQLPIPLVLLGSRLMIEQDKANQKNNTSFDWQRVHYLELPPVTTQQITKKLEQTHPYLNPEERYNTAARISQYTEGWFPYVQKAIERPSKTVRVPESLSRMLCTMQGQLSKELMAAFAKLALVQGRFTPEFVDQLLDQDSKAALQTGLNTELLTQASDFENLDLHTLVCRTKDHEHKLGFRSELNRIAFAASISPDKRQAIRVELAEMFLETQPMVSLYYAERAQLPHLVNKAKSKLTRCAIAQHKKANYTPALAPAIGHSIERTITTPNGYQITRSKERTEIRRRGRLFDLTHLNLNGLCIQPGHWSMVLRLDIAPTTANIAEEITYPLALRFGGGSWKTFSATPIPNTEIEGIPTEFIGTLPTEQWIRINGYHNDDIGTLQLGVRAVDVSLTIASLENNGQRLL